VQEDQDAFTRILRRSSTVFVAENGIVGVMKPQACSFTVRSANGRPAPGVEAKNTGGRQPNGGGFIASSGLKLQSVEEERRRRMTECDQAETDSRETQQDRKGLRGEVVDEERLEEAVAKGWQVHMQS